MFDFLMNEEQKKIWDAAYGPENEKFIADMKAGKLSDKDVVRWKYQRYIKDYLRCIRAVYEGVGRLLDYLDDSGLADNTIVIYSSDQGFYLGDHGWYDKRWMYEESIKMPLIVRWPGLTDRPRVDRALHYHYDWTATLVEGCVDPLKLAGEGDDAAKVLDAMAHGKRTSLRTRRSAEPNCGCADTAQLRTWSGWSRGGSNP